MIPGQKIVIIKPFKGLYLFGDIGAGGGGGVCVCVEGVWWGVGLGGGGGEERSQTKTKKNYYKNAPTVHHENMPI